MNRRNFILSTTALAALSISACSREAALPPEPGTPTSLAGVRGQAYGFQAGNAMARAQAVVFFDTQCPHCGSLWRAAEALHDKVNILWVPCGLLNRASVSQGAALLEAQNPVLAMHEHEQLLSSGRGGMAASGAPSRALIDQIRSNTALFSRIGGTSVPLLVRERDGALQLRTGSMSTAELARLMGLPE